MSVYKVCKDSGYRIADSGYGWRITDFYTEKLIFLSYRDWNFFYGSCRAIHCKSAIPRSSRYGLSVPIPAAVGQYEKVWSTQFWELKHSANSLTARTPGRDGNALKNHCVLEPLLNEMKGLNEEENNKSTEDKVQRASLLPSLQLLNILPELE